MNKHTEKVVALLLNLPLEEREQAVKEINSFLAQGGEKRQMIKEAFASRAGIPLGPTSEGKCAYCGK